MLDMIHHRPAALAIVDFLEQFNDGKGATDAQGTGMARALNAALRMLALDSVSQNPAPDLEAFREWFYERIDATKMKHALPKGPEEKEMIDDDAIAEVRKHLDSLAQTIGLVGYVCKRRTRRKTGSVQADAS